MMIYTITVLVIIFSAVVVGIFNRRWAVACAILVLHVAIAGFVMDCVSSWSSKHQRMASPTGSHALGKKYWVTLPGKS